MISKPSFSPRALASREKLDHIAAMSEKSESPAKKPARGGKLRTIEREERLRSALRKNLARRKKQARARRELPEKRS